MQLVTVKIDKPEARSRGASVATHNAKDFEGCGIDVVAPWSA